MASETPGYFTGRYVDTFFDSMFAIETKGNRDKLSMLKAGLREFISSETDENASIVYRSFRNSYRLAGEADMLGLIELMHTFEKRADKMVDSQRDHYVHSINVFIMGLSVYSTSEEFRQAFLRSRRDSTFGNPDEEFLYIWGLASMFHDIGYPIEISYNKIRRFLRAASYQVESKITPVPLIKGMEELMIREGDIDSLDILAKSVSSILDIPYDDAGSALRGYEADMYESCRIDHGYFSSLMLLKWMSNIHSMYGRDAVNPVVEASTAILMHNFHGHTFTKPPYGLGPLGLDADPISYLLILCDELQEWNRVAYGTTVKNVYPSKSRYVISNGHMSMEFRTSSSVMSKDFPSDKRRTLERLLRLDDLFQGGIEIVCTCERSSDLFLKEFDGSESEIPDFFVDMIEDVAKAIHEDYVRKRIETGQIEYGDWDSLRDDLKLSNIKQAYGYFDKLSAIGCVMSRTPIGESVEELTDEEVEFLSIIEHDRWVTERKASGWVYGEEKDSDNRISPYMVGWDAITEEIREYDREAVRNILPILRKMGVGVYRT